MKFPIFDRKQTKHYNNEKVYFAGTTYSDKYEP